MSSISIPISPDEVHQPRAGWFDRYILATDHKIIGIQFLFLGLFFFIVAGLLAMVIRWQLAWPGDGWISPTHPGHPVPILAKLLWPVLDGDGVVHGGPMPPEFYNIALTMHATLMVFFVVIPILVGAFGNYLIPLKIGAHDMAFPFLNGLTFWATLYAGILLICGFFLPGGAAATGWTSYPPLATILFNGAGFSPGGIWPNSAAILNFAALFMFLFFLTWHLFQYRWMAVLLAALAAAAVARFIQIAAFDGQSCWFLSLIVLGSASVLGAVNYLTTIVMLRCPGMTMFRLPLSVWSLFITALLVLLATPVLAAALVMNLLDHHRLTSFFEPLNWIDNGQISQTTSGGYALLHPHLFWFYSHPAVYIMILPAMGIVSDILAVFSRKPVFGYRPMIYAMGAIAFLGFIVWGHHMFQSGMNPALGTTFAVSTMFIAVPSAIKVFNWLATLWRGNIRLTVPLLNAAAFVSLFVIGGLSGIFLASTAVDAQLHMSYFVVAHIHYVLFGGSMFGIFAAIYFYYPKMFGRMMNPALGYIHFVLSYIAFNCTFFTMHILGLQGFPRRMADYRNYNLWAHLQPMNQFITMSAMTLGLAQIALIINFIGSWIWGKKALANPWQATTLEWNDTTSPPPPENFETIPVVYRGPYEYSSPLVEEDWLPQTKLI